MYSGTRLDIAILFASLLPPDAGRMIVEDHRAGRCGHSARRWSSTRCARLAISLRMWSSCPALCRASTSCF